MFFVVVLNLFISSRRSTTGINELAELLYDKQKMTYVMIVRLRTEAQRFELQRRIWLIKEAP